MLATGRLVTPEPWVYSPMTKYPVVGQIVTWIKHDVVVPPQMRYFCKLSGANLAGIETPPVPLVVAKPETEFGVDVMGFHDKVHNLPIRTA